MRGVIWPRDRLSWSACGWPLPPLRRRRRTNLRPPLRNPLFEQASSRCAWTCTLTKDGKPVTDLRADEIELFEDGVPHAIQTFERIAVAAHTTAPPTDSRSLAERRRMRRTRVPALCGVRAASRAQPLARRCALLRAAGLIQGLNSLLGPDDLRRVMTSDMRVADLTFERRLPVTTSAWPSQSDRPPIRTLGRVLPGGIPWQSEWRDESALPGTDDIRGPRCPDRASGRPSRRAQARAGPDQWLPAVHEER